MTNRFLIATAVLLGLGTGIAMAQTNTAQPDAAPAPGMDSTLPSGWSGAIGDAFFSDPAAGTLRSEDEVRANWEGLSDEQQAQVRAECTTVASAQAQPKDNMTTGSVTPGNDNMHMASIQQACEWVDAM